MRILPVLIDKNNYEPPIQTAELFLFVESFFHQSIEFFISNIIVSVKNIRLAVMFNQSYIHYLTLNITLFYIS